jgi:hypothetical protein
MQHMQKQQMQKHIQAIVRRGTCRTRSVYGHCAFSQLPGCFYILFLTFFQSCPILKQWYTFYIFYIFFLYQPQNFLSDKYSDK